MWIEVVGFSYFEVFLQQGFACRRVVLFIDQSIQFAEPFPAGQALFAIESSDCEIFQKDIIRVVALGGYASPDDNSEIRVEFENEAFLRFELGGYDRAVGGEEQLTIWCGLLVVPD